MSAIFFDIDGTIFDGTKIHQEVIDAIKETQKKRTLLLYCQWKTN